MSYAGSFRIHQAESRRVPDLVGKVSIRFDTYVIPFDVGTGGDRREIDPRRVDAEFVEHLDRVDAVVARLGHRLAVFAENGSGDDTIFERRLAGEFLA